MITRLVARGTAALSARVPRVLGSLLLGYAALLTFFRMAPLRGWDEAFYIGQLTSLFSDADLMLQNDLLAFDNSLAIRFRALTTLVDSGALHDPELNHTIEEQTTCFNLILTSIWPWSPVDGELPLYGVNFVGGDP